LRTHRYFRHDARVSKPICELRPLQLLSPTCKYRATLKRVTNVFVDQSAFSMTSRTILTLLMLAQVVTCPLLDCGECRGACAARCIEVDAACSDCCESESVVCEHDTDPCDDPACPDNPGPLDCLCGGAVQVDAVECPDLLAGGQLVALPSAALSQFTLLIGATSGEIRIDGCPHFPPLITGTSVCALTQTYLL